VLKIFGVSLHWCYDHWNKSMGFHIINFLVWISTCMHFWLSCISMFDQMYGRLGCYYYIASWIVIKSYFQCLETCLCLFKRKKNLYDAFGFSHLQSSRSNTYKIYFHLISFHAYFSYCLMFSLINKHNRT